MDETQPLPVDGGLRRVAIGAREHLRRHRRGLVELFLGVLVPFCALALLARWVIHPQPPAWDVAVLRWFHGHASPERDRAVVWITQLGTWAGVIPVTIGLLGWYVGRRRPRKALFVFLSMVGEWLLNNVAKAFYGRPRPALWPSPAPEVWFSFPSGHAMASMALGTVVTVLAWPTRARWPVALLSALFVVAVGASRLYLGVHYPSDILAAWLASFAWVFGLRLLLLPRAHRSPRTPG